jgi:hypothetical protein
MSAPLQLFGMRFGKLLVLQEAYRENGKLYWSCQCDCGNQKEIHGVNLKRGNTKSCGCGTFRFPTKHGLHKAPEYQTWADMLARCTNPASGNWHHYGGRGIRVCKRWKGPSGFQNFYADMGPRPKETSLDRINNDDGYKPSNCRWASTAEQANNTRSVHSLTYQGQTLSVSQWSRQLGIGVPAIFSRIRLGWPTDRILTTPTKTKTIDLTYKGETLSLSAWGRRFGISYQTIQTRLHAGWPVERTLITPSKRLLTFKGLTLSTSGWAKRLGLTKNVINDRLRAGWSLKRVLTKPLPSRH